MLEDAGLVYTEVGSIATAIEALRVFVERDWLRFVCSQAMRQAADDPEGAQAALLDTLTSHSAQMNSQTAGMTAQEAVMAFYDAIHARASDEAPPALLYGYPSMDRCTLGLAVDQLILLAARPSVGKSALAMNWTRN